MKEQATAQLARVKIAKYYGEVGSLESCLVAYGEIYNDKKFRFGDGYPVRTSSIVKIEDGCIHTMNSIYEVI